MIVPAPRPAIDVGEHTAWLDDFAIEAGQIVAIVGVTYADGLGEWFLRLPIDTDDPDFLPDVDEPALAEHVTDRDEWRALREEISAMVACEVARLRWGQLWQRLEEGGTA